MSLRHTDWHWHCQWIENITGTTALCNSHVGGGGGCYRCRSARSPPPHSRHINCRRLAVVVVAAAVADKGAAAKLCALLL